MTDHIAPLPIDIYIYYRVEDTVTAVASVQAMQAKLAAKTGIHGRLMRSCNDDTTLMEIYPCVTDVVAFEDALAQQVTAHELEELISEGMTRHTERFVCA